MCNLCPNSLEFTFELLTIGFWNPNRLSLAFMVKNHSVVDCLLYRLQWLLNKIFLSLNTLLLIFPGFSSKQLQCTQMTQFCLHIHSLPAQVTSSVFTLSIKCNTEIAQFLKSNMQFILGSTSKVKKFEHNVIVLRKENICVLYLFQIYSILNFNFYYFGIIVHTLH